MPDSTPAVVDTTPVKVSSSTTIRPAAKAISTELVVVGPSGTETYALNVLPDLTSSLVVAARETVTRNMNVSTLVTELDRAAELLFIAKLGCTGIVDLDENLTQRQIDLQTLVTSSGRLIDSFETNTDRILGRVKRAFSHLFALDEARALTTLTAASDYATAMSVACKNLQTEFQTLKAAIDTDLSAVTAKNAEEHQLADDLEKQRGKMLANQSQQQVISDGIGDTIEKLTAAISECKSDIKTQEKRAFIMGIVGAVMQGVGTAVGSGMQMFMTASNPVGALVSKIPDEVAEITKAVQAGQKSGTTTTPATTRDDTTATTGDDTTATTGDDTTATTADDTTATTADDTTATTADKTGTQTEAEKKAAAVAADPEVEEAIEDLKTADAKLETASKEKLDAQDAFDEAKTPEAKAAAETVLTDKSDAEDTAQTERDAANDTLLKKQSAAYGVAQGLKQTGGDVSKLGAQANQNGQSIRAQLTTLMTQMREAERLQREAKGQLASLAQQLKSETEQANSVAMAMKSLEMSIWALSNIDVTLNAAVDFWARMATFCTDLASSPFIDDLKEEFESDDDPQERLDFYLSSDFFPMCVYYTAHWVALNSLCKDWGDAAAETVATVGDNISAALPQDKARAALPARVEQLKAEIASERAASHARSQEMADAAANPKLAVDPDDVIDVRPEPAAVS